MKVLCTNELGQISVDQTKASLLLQAYDQQTPLRMCDFLLLRQRLNDINWKAILLNTDPKDDYFHLNLSIRSPKIIFKLADALRLRDLVNTAYFYFSLKDMLTRSEVTMEYDIAIPTEQELLVLN
ncbi:hypothetical protein D3C78_1364810 [compost metagenome]